MTRSKKNSHPADFVGRPVWPKILSLRSPEIFTTFATTSILRPKNAKLRAKFSRSSKAMAMAMVAPRRQGPRKGRLGLVRCRLCR